MWHAACIVHGQLVIRLFAGLIRYLDKRSVGCMRYDIDVILLCNTGMRGSNLSVRASSVGDEHGIKRSIAELRSFDDSTRFLR